MGLIAAGLLKCLDNPWPKGQPLAGPQDKPRPKRELIVRVQLPKHICTYPKLELPFKKTGNLHNLYLGLWDPHGHADMAVSMNRGPFWGVLITRALLFSGVYTRAPCCGSSHFLSYPECPDT